ncbi:hypothetical protein [Streptomyces sp. WAC06614]|uniref:hypothetical protein n=1 Tax=Streptomyces sp. WAC06614 TaxID=2487416 RepID=UPI000F79E018|nr:hypothetical protein [Streptomyces sp. WAC06614]RSS79574.1 hypothetical protein EF918_16820 [Streptomyces sp. WAC06614]
MTNAWENREYGDLIDHLTQLRRRGRFVQPGRTLPVSGCASCRGVRRVVLVDGERRVVYSEPCLSCRGGGAQDREHSPA